MNTSEKTYGFATFFKEDGLYYFQFNDQAGRPVFYGNGYQLPRSRDRGIKSVIRNAGDEKKYERKQSKKGLYYFILKSGNQQEIGRSVTFDTQAEMEEAMNLLKGITKEVPIFDAAECSSKKETSTTQAAIEKVEEKGSKELPAEKLPRYKFSIIYYPDSDIWSVKHDPSGNTKQLKTCDGQLIEAFLKAHLPAGKTKGVPTQALGPSKTLTQKGIPQKQEEAAAEEVELKLRSIRGEEVQHFIKAGKLAQLEISPKKGSTVPLQTYEAKVIAKSLTDNQPVMVVELKEQKPAFDRFLIPIYEANRLKPGMYRFTVTIHQGKAGEEEHDYKGSRMVMFS